MTAAVQRPGRRTMWAASRAWVSRELRPYLSIAAALVAYAILRVVFTHVVGTGGFATPGSLDHGLAAFALVMLVMRITVLVGVPLAVTYRLVHRLFRIGRSDGDVTVSASSADSTQTHELPPS